MKPSVLILCTGSSCRSQMAEGILRHFGEGRYEVESAGTKPSKVNETAILVMREIGIDLSAHRSKSAEEFRRVRDRIRTKFLSYFLPDRSDS